MGGGCYPKGAQGFAPQTLDSTSWAPLPACVGKWAQLQCPFGTSFHSKNDPCATSLGGCRLASCALWRGRGDPWLALLGWGGGEGVPFPPPTLSVSFWFLIAERVIGWECVPLPVVPPKEMWGGRGRANIRQTEA